MKNKVISIILAVILGLCGIGALISGIFASNKELVSVTTLYGDELDGSADYEIQEAYIIDSYATYDENDVPKTWYLLVGFFDAEDSLYVVSMELEKDDDIYDTVMNYLDDDDMYIGDLVLPVYATAVTFASDSDLGQYFGSYLVNLNNHDFACTANFLQLDYMGGTMEAYEANSSKDSTGTIIMGVVFLILAVLFPVVVSKKNKRLAHTTEDFDYEEKADTFCPNCGARVPVSAKYCDCCGERL